MSETTDIYVQALIDLCKAKGGYVKVAEVIGANAPGINQIINRTKLPSGRPRGVGPTLRDKLDAAFPGWCSQQPAAVKKLDETNKNRGIKVPLLANAASMGGGDDVLTEDVITGELTLTPEFVTEQLRPARPEFLRFIHAYGDSMSPTLNSGDVVLVNTSVQDASVDGIYVLEAHNRLFIKRVSTRLDGKHEISSDNPAKKTVDILNGDHEVAIKGRVIWVWNGKKI